MPDIGVLSLQIHSESTQAENSLRRLEGALSAIRTAVNGNGLGGAVRALERLNRAVNVNTVVNLNGLAAAMKKIQDACNFTVPNLSGLNRARTAMEGIASGAQAIRETQRTAAELSEGFAEAAAQVRTVSTAVSEVNKAVETTAESVKSQLDFSKFDPAKLPLGALGAKISETSQEMIRFGGIVKETFQITQKMGADKSLGYLTEMKGRVDELFGQWQNAVVAGRDATELLKNSFNDPNVSGSQKVEILEQYDKAMETIRTLREELLQVDKQAGDVAKTIGTSYESVLQSVENYSNAVYGEIQAEKIAEKNREMVITQLRRLEYYKNNYKTMSDKDRGDFKGMFANNPMMSKAIDDIERYVAAQEKLQEVTTGTVEISKDAGGIISSAGIDENITKLELLREKLEIVRDEFANKLEKGKINDKGINNYLLKIVSLREQIEKLQLQYQSMGISAGKVVDDDEAVRIADNFMNMNTAASLAKDRIEELKIALGNGIITGDLGTKQIISMRNEIERLQTQVDSAQKSASWLTMAFSSMKRGISGLFGKLTKLGHQFTNIARRMAMRAVIKMFVNGLKEGLENIYYWSKANNTEFAPSLNAAATAVLNLKNSLGAMAAEALSALLPVFIQLVDVIIDGVNWLNQFFAAAQGKDTFTYYKKNSEMVTDAFGTQEKAAKKASKAINELLADWDELNIIQSQSSGSGGGASASNFSSGEYEIRDVEDTVARGLGKFVHDHPVLTIGVAAAAVIGAKIAGAIVKRHFITSGVNKVLDNRLEDIKKEIKGEMDDIRKQIDENANKGGEPTQVDKAKEVIEQNNTTQNIENTKKLTSGQDRLITATEENTKKLTGTTEEVVKLAKEKFPNGKLTGDVVNPTVSQDRLLTATNENVKAITGAASETAKLTEAVSKIATSTVPTTGPYGTYTPIGDIDNLPYAPVKWPKRYLTEATTQTAPNDPLDSIRKTVDEIAYQQLELDRPDEAFEQMKRDMEQVNEATQKTADRVASQIPGGTNASNAMGLVVQNGSIIPNGTGTNVAEEFWKMVSEKLDQKFDGAFITTPGGEVMYSENAELLKGLHYFYDNYGGLPTGTKVDFLPNYKMGKLEQAYWNLNNVDWGKVASSGMMAAMVAGMIKSFGQSRLAEERAYTDYYGKDYTNLSAIGKAFVREGVAPELADILSTTIIKEFNEKLGIGDAFEWIKQATDDVALTIGEAGETLDRDVIDPAKKIFSDMDTAIFGPLAMLTAPDEQTKRSIQKDMDNNLFVQVGNAVLDEAKKTWEQAGDYLKIMMDAVEDEHSNEDTVQYTDDDYTSGRRWNPYLVTGEAGVSDVGWKGYSGMYTENTAEDQAKAVEKGNGGNLYEILSTLNRNLTAYMRNEANRQTVVVPSTALGFVTKRSNAMTGAVTGYDEG